MNLKAMSSCIKSYQKGNDFPCEENGSIIRFQVTAESAHRLKIDQCLIKTEIGKRCDYLVYSSELAYLIELKGSRARDGVEQLIETVHNFSELPEIKSGLQSNEVHFYVVSKGGTRIKTSSEFKQLLVKLKGKCQTKKIKFKTLEIVSPSASKLHPL